MNKMKNKIQALFIKAMKEKDEVSKRTLSSLKSKITEFEKSGSNIKITNKDILIIISKAIKERAESRKIYLDQNREDLAVIEKEEIDILVTLLPPKMTLEEVKIKIGEILLLIDPDLPEQAQIGKTIGIFNKEYPSQCSVDKLREIIKEKLC